MEWYGDGFIEYHNVSSDGHMLGEIGIDMIKYGLKVKGNGMND